MNEVNPYQPSVRDQTRDSSVSEISIPADPSPLWRGIIVGAIVGGAFGLLMFVLLLIVLRPFGLEPDPFFVRLDVEKWLILVALFLAGPLLFGMVSGAAGFWFGDLLLRRFPWLRNWLRLGSSPK